MNARLKYLDFVGSKIRHHHDSVYLLDFILVSFLITVKEITSKCSDSKHFQSLFLLLTLFLMTLWCSSGLGSPQSCIWMAAAAEKVREQSDWCLIHHLSCFMQFQGVRVLLFGLSRVIISSQVTKAASLGDFTLELMLHHSYFMIWYLLPHHLHNFRRKAGEEV